MRDADGGPLGKSSAGVTTDSAGANLPIIRDAATGKDVRMPAALQPPLPKTLSNTRSSSIHTRSADGSVDGAKGTKVTSILVLEFAFR
jgi:hypothetical protein